MAEQSTKRQTTQWLKEQKRQTTQWLNKEQKYRQHND
jgi:hypothetical protein